MQLEGLKVQDWSYKTIDKHLQFVRGAPVLLRGEMGAWGGADKSRVFPLDVKC